MSADLDQWFTAPLECSHCGSEGHERRYCAAFKEEMEEAREMKADEMREERWTNGGYYEREVTDDGNL